MGTLTRVQSSNTAALEAQRRAAAAERARQLAEAARKAAEAAKRAAEEAQAKLKDALQKPNANPTEVAKLRDAATKLQAKADAAEKLAVQREAAAGLTKPASTFTQTEDAFTPCVQPSDATSDAKFIVAAAQNGNGLEALSGALAKHPNDPSYAAALVEQSKEALLASVREKAATDPVTAAQELSKLVDAMPDAATRKQLVDASRDSISQMVSTAAQRGTPEQNEQLLRELAHVGSVSGPDGMKAVTDAVAQTWPTTQSQFVKRDLTLSNPLALANFNNQLCNAAESGPFTDSLVRSLDEAGKTDVAQGVRDSQAMVSPNSMIQGARGDFNQAKSNVEANNQRLQQELSRLGPNLSEAQKQQYIRDFNAQPQVKADLEALSKAAKNLGATLEKVATSTDATPETLQLAVDSAKELAKSPVGAVAAKDFAAKLLEKGGVTDAQKASLEDTIQDSAPNVYADMLRQSGGDPKAAAERFAAQFEFLEQNRNVFSNLQPLQKAVDALRTGELSGLREIGTDNKFGKTFKALGVMFSVAKLAGGPDAEAQTYIKEVSNAGKEGLELLAEAMKRYGEVFKEAKYAGGVSTAGSLIEKFTPGLALVANSISMNMDAVKLNSRNGNWGDLVSLIGNATATLGSALEVTGVGVGPGKLLQAVGAITAGVGGLVSMVKSEQQVTDEMRSLLGKQPELEGITEPLMNRDVKRLAESTGLSPEDVQRFVRTSPELFANEGTLRRFVNIAAASGLKGGRVLELAEAAKKNPAMLAQIGDEPEGIIRTLLPSYPEARAVLLRKE